MYRNYVIIGLCIILGISVGFNVFYIRQNRIELGRLEELKRESDALQQEFREYNNRSREYITEMGTELQRDLSTITETEELVKVLREQVKSLQDYYTYLDRSERIVDSSIGGN